jgi:hypothetical protein
MPSVMSYIKQKSLEIQKQIFENDCEIVLNLPLNFKDLFKADLEEFSSLELEVLGIY